MSRLSSALRGKRVKSIIGYYCSAVVVAAGSSARMGEDKLALTIGGMPVLARTLLALEGCPDISEIIVVTRSEKIPGVARLCRDYNISKASKILTGGENRTESVLAGVSEINPKASLVAIHDGARPLVTGELISRVVHAAALHNAAAPAVKPQDTIKTAVGGIVSSTPDRDGTFLVQTPQVFIPDLIKAALTKAVLDRASVTDDCAAVERMGFQVRLVEGEDSNIKLTAPQDLTLMEYFLGTRG